MTTRSILGLIYMVQGLKQLGEDPEPVLQRHGLSSDKLDPTTRIERARELRIYAEWAETLHDPLIGLKMGSFFGLAGYGPLVMLLMTCATAYEALQTGIRYQRLTYLYGTLRLEPGERMSALILDPMMMGPKAFRFRVDGEASGTYKMVRDMQATMGLNLRAERLDMPYPKPPEAAAYEEHFGCPVRWGEHEVRFWLRNEYLQIKLPTADPNAHAMYRTMCDQQLKVQEATTASLADRVLNHLGMFNGHFPSAEEVAKSFDMSERSLRRQLSEDGRSFRDLLADARYAKARYLLKNTRLPIEDIAAQIGYAESAAFIHAFRRWAGATPGEFRDQ
ncbi:MAG: AraC family transcriptional regulator [Aquabacterium sp.]|uniref:AraC family transcriptional regulator n=1 Tax=Aquabacterium sp. TaxID=1872578 RepID=UPI0025C22277|nr:AraC family transcriptional regulator [Aquabacterium sp.]MBI5925099.1 AraC family transcriptional regulator [Aquabacterium sp.]